MSQGKDSKTEKITTQDIKHEEIFLCKNVFLGRVFFSCVTGDCPAVLFTVMSILGGLVIGGMLLTSSILTHKFEGLITAVVFPFVVDHIVIYHYLEKQIVFSEEYLRVFLNHVIDETSRSEKPNCRRIACLTNKSMKAVCLFFSGNDCRLYVVRYVVVPVETSSLDQDGSGMLHFSWQ